MNNARPKRPLGLTLAIITSGLIFAVLPLAQSLFLLGVNRYQYETPEGVIVGTGISNFNATPYLLQAGLAVVFLMVCVLCAMGRPRGIRWVFSLVVLCLGSYVLLAQILPTLTAVPTLQDGLDSTTALRRPLQWGQLFLVASVTTYSVWFANRWSSRAFFRGFYTEAEQLLLKGDSES
jgi:hypothetical protein